MVSSQAPSRQSLLWSAPAACDFCMDEFDTVTVLFDPRSGDTHLLDVLSREVLDLIADQPRTTGDLARALGDLMPTTAYDEIAARVDDIVDHLDRMGLIYPSREQGSA
ncbi:MAG: HPr-rel-A system PqqD family peptide chaperone [Alphaproteobacteria bacterium]|nr:MAG: HPr-rel-A system PqqD family peptide chaperone [Alphaproteobacteria bacterium]